MNNLVAIVGRPNVGKSTLFNRLIEKRDAIVDPTSGVTRDRHYGYAEWNGRNFSVIDTGGYTQGTDDVFEKNITEQVKLAIEESSSIIFMVDILTGITDFDADIADILRRSKKPVFVVANKADTNDLLTNAADFYSLGLGEVFPISSSNGSGTGELLDALVSKFNEGEDLFDDSIPRIAVVGKPNVGKSSLINAFVNEDRNIVNEQAGTTRDSVDTRYKAYGFDFILIDTAGIRKKSKVHENIEFYSVLRSIKAIEESDVCIMMIDATEGMQKQDLAIFYTVLKAYKGVVILVNKWDLIEKETQTMDSYRKQILERISPFTDVNIIFTSTISKQRIHKTLETALEVYQNRKQKFSTSSLNDLMLPDIEHNPPPAHKGKYIRIKYITQIPTFVPTIAFFCNLPQYIKEPYKRFLENRLRKHYTLTGVPIRLFFRKKNK
jgi:GTP-binding protein